MKYELFKNAENNTYHNQQFIIIILVNIKSWNFIV